MCVEVTIVNDDEDAGDRTVGGRGGPTCGQWRGRGASAPPRSRAASGNSKPRRGCLREGAKRRTRPRSPRGPATRRRTRRPARRGSPGSICWPCAVRSRNLGGLPPLVCVGLPSPPPPTSLDFQHADHLQDVRALNRRGTGGSRALRLPALRRAGHDGGRGRSAARTPGTRATACRGCRAPRT